MIFGYTLGEWIVITLWGLMVSASIVILSSAIIVLLDWMLA